MKRIIMLTALVLGITACSSKPDIKEFPKSADAKEEINNLDLAIQNSQSKDLALLAPESFKEARHSLKEAKKMEKDDKDEEDILQEVALGNAYLEQAEKNAQRSEGKMPGVLAARNAAINAEANTLLREQFKDMDDKVKEQTSKLDQDKDDNLKDKRSDYIAGYSDLELAAIKKKSLGESKTLIDSAAKKGARELTPMTWTDANTKYKEADTYISENRYDTDEINVRAAAALAAAEKLDATVTTAKGLSKTSTEQTALQIQSDKESLSRTEEALMAEQGASAALLESNIELSKEQQLNAAYERARAQFSPEEAEVYKQGSNLVIRLKGLEFPKSEAVLRGDNFALLKKVDTVIESFDKSRVVVEGHTDSTGGEKVNQTLSSERAEAVKKYLEANTSESVTEFESQGFGFDKPIASNKTPQGRAQNRRVDVIIQPQQI